MKPRGLSYPTDTHTHTLTAQRAFSHCFTVTPLLLGSGWCSAAAMLVILLWGCAQTTHGMFIRQNKVQCTGDYKAMHVRSTFGVRKSKILRLHWSPCSSNLLSAPWLSTVTKVLFFTFQSQGHWGGDDVIGGHTSSRAYLSFQVYHPWCVLDPIRTAVSTHLLHVLVSKPFQNLLTFFN